MRIIAGKWKRKNIVSPQGNLTRPTSDQLRETLFNILTSYFTKNNVRFDELNVLDVFAGTGALGLEALSRGAKHATFIEKNAAACQAIQKNIVTFEIDTITTLLRKDIKTLYHTEKPNDFLYDLILLDAPYNQGLNEIALSILYEQKWLHPKALVVIETEFDETLILSKTWILKEERKINRAKLWLFTQQF